MTNRGRPRLTPEQFERSKERTREVTRKRVARWRKLQAELKREDAKADRIVRRLLRKRPLVT